VDGSNDLYHGLEKRNTNSLNAYPFDDSETSTGERHSMCERYAGLGSYITSMLGSKQAIFPLIFPLVFVACGWALRGWVCFIAPIYYPRKRAHTFFFLPNWCAWGIVPGPMACTLHLFAIYNGYYWYLSYLHMVISQFFIY